MGIPTFLSPSVPNGGLLPLRCSAEGQGLSPALRWRRIPSGYRYLCMVMRSADRRSGALTSHWLLYNVLVFLGPIAEGEPKPPGVVGLNEDGLAAYLPPSSAPKAANEAPQERDITFSFHLYRDEIQADCPLGWDIIRHQLTGINARGPYTITCFYPTVPARAQEFL